LANKPFALIGVNTNGYTPAKLKDVVGNQKLNWRSFADRGEGDKDGESGPLCSKWNLQGTPTIYLLDASGVIRHRWIGSPGEKTLDAAIKRLLQDSP
jgi:hypothetical protein